MCKTFERIKFWLRQNFAFFTFVRIFVFSVPSRPNSDVSSFQTLEDPSYLDYRAEAFQHYNLRDECFKKAALAFSKKQGQLAQFYAQQVCADAAKTTTTTKTQRKL